MHIGDYRVEVVPDTLFRLDGGAMFGVVPRVLWERSCPPDELNRIELNANCLFIDTGKEKILIETGIGEKWTAKETAMYGITRVRSFSESLLSTTGCLPEDITIVINTHLHFDHAGGNTVSSFTRDEARISADPRDIERPLEIKGLSDDRHAHRNFKEIVRYVPQFPNARYMVSKAEYQHGESPHERDRASYLPENWHPLIESGQLDLMPDTFEPVPGLLIEQVRGHSETMQTISLTRGGQTLFGFFDLVPTRHHLTPAWIMAYDLYPTETLEFKKRVLPQALEENWICHFYHDVEHPLCRLSEVNGKISAVPFGTL